MTSAYGTQAELLYSMPGAGASASAPGAVSVILTGNTTTNPAYQLPPLASMWPFSQLPGKALGVRARGTFGTPASSPGTWVIGCGLNTTQATKPASTVLAATGAFTPVAPILSITNGQWDFAFDITVGAAGTNAGASPNVSIFTGGTLGLGAGNNAATAANVEYMLGSATAISINPTTSFWVEMYATFSTGPASTVLQCNQFMVFGYN